LQADVNAIISAAQAGDYAAAKARLDALQHALTQATAEGDVTSDRQARIAAAIDLVRADLAALIPPATPAPQVTAPTGGGTSGDDGSSGGDSGKGGNNGNGNGKKNNGNSGNGNGNSGNNGNGNGNSGNGSGGSEGDGSGSGTGSDGGTTSGDGAGDGTTSGDGGSDGGSSSTPVPTS
jgi:hypothetical protein